MTGIAKDYAAALFMLAAEENKQDDISRDVKLIQQMFSENPEYAELLSSPALGFDEAESIIDEAFGESISENAASFLKILCRRGHISQIDDCAKEFDALYKASKQISTAKVVSAAELSADQSAALKLKLEKLTGHTVELQCYTDDTLMAGLTVEIDGKILDGSLKHRLNEVKEVISK